MVTNRFPQLVEQEVFVPRITAHAATMAPTPTAAVQ